MTGTEFDTLEDATQAAKQLQEKGCKNVILTLGSRGALLVNPDHPEGHLIETTKLEAVDTVGAGDCFCGAFAHFYTSEDLDMAEAIRRACLTASISVTRAGTMSSYPSKSEVAAAGIVS